MPRDIGELRDCNTLFDQVTYLIRKSYVCNEPLKLIEESINIESNDDEDMVVFLINLHKARVYKKRLGYEIIHLFNSRIIKLAIPNETCEELRNRCICFYLLWSKNIMIGLCSPDEVYSFLEDHSFMLTLGYDASEIKLIKMIASILLSMV